MRAAGGGVSRDDPHLRIRVIPDTGFCAACDNGDVTDPATAHHAPVGAEWLDRPVPIFRGIALGLSHRWGAHVAVVRTGFVVLCCAGGIGLVAYGAASLLPAVATQRPPTIRGDVGVVLIVAALVAAVTAMVPWLPTSLLWLITLAAMGAAVSAASGSQEPSDASLRGAPWRTGVGALLVLVGMGAALSGAGGIETLWRAVLIAVAVLGGMAMVVAPWLQRLIRSVEYERRERVRVEERADIAAHSTIRCCKP